MTGSSGESDGRVDRRQMMRGALLGGVALAASGAGCGVTATQAPPPRWSGKLDRRAADELLASIDKRLSWIDEQTLPEDIAPLSKLEKMEGAAEQIATKTTLTRKAMRALYLTGRFADLPDELKAHPGVQARLAAAQTDMDDAVLGMTAMLEAMTPDDHRGVQRHLRAHPELAERIARYIERPAKEDGLPFRRAFGIRAGILQLGGRMAAQSPALITDPLVRKVRRIEARPHPAADQARLVASRIGEEAFWEYQEKMALINQAWLAELGPEGVMAATAPAVQTGVAEPETTTKEDHTVRTGAIIMGFGGGSILLALLYWGIAEATGAEGPYWPAIVLGVTIGPLLLIIGLIVVIVGAARSSGE